ncbi:hypothetical protein CHU98_g9347 [Xylaria longipes]|nr:hypothetical protein CHU98_g9347 [Xylaria longipes]
MRPRTTRQPRSRTWSPQRSPLGDVTEHHHASNTNTDADRADTHTRRKRKVKHELPLIKCIARRRHQNRRHQTGTAPPPRPLPTPTPPFPKAQPYKPGLLIWSGDVVLHRFNDVAQFNSAVRVFARLPSIHGLSGPALRLCNTDRSKLEIHVRYPKHRILTVVELLHLNKLDVCDVRKLRDAVLHNVGVLCTSRVALSRDVSFLRAVQYDRPEALVPLLDTFDLDLCAKHQYSNTADWAKLEKDIVQKVESQFQVFEFVAQIESTLRSQPESKVDLKSPFRSQSNVELDPEDALRIIKANSPPIRMWYLIVMQVRKYTPALAGCTIDEVTYNLLRLPKRSDLSAACYPRRALPRWELASYCSTIKHMLQLGTADESVQQDIRLLADRASLCVLYTTALVYLHAKVVKRCSLKGLLRLGCPGLADAYTSSEGFDLVTEAYRDAQAAIRTLYDAGGELHKDTRWFIRDKIGQTKTVPTS